MDKAIHIRQRVKLLGAYILCSVLTTFAADYDFESDGIYYKILSQQQYTVQVVANPEGTYSGDIVIPSTVRNFSYPHKVISIGEKAFYKSDITSMIIGEGVTEIKDYAIGGCNALEYLKLPDGLVYIGENAISGKSLKSLIIPESVNVCKIYHTGFVSCKFFWLPSAPPEMGILPIGYHDYQYHYVPNNYYQYGRNTLVYPHLNSMFTVDGLTYIPVDFENPSCDLVDNEYGRQRSIVKISDSVTYKNITMSIRNVMPHCFDGNKWMFGLEYFHNGDIAASAFSKCTILTKATIETEGIVGARAFSGCGKLGEVIVSKAQGLGHGCFVNCSNLKSAILDNSISKIGSSAFEGCSSLETMRIPNDVDTLEELTFRDCTSLKSITLPSALRHIGASCLIRCTSLERLDIPANVDTLWSFSSLPGLKTLSFENNYRDLTFKRFSDDKELRTYSELFPESKTVDSLYIGRDLVIKCSYSPFVSVCVDGYATTIPQFLSSGKLQRVYIGGDVATVPKEAFKRCSALEHIELGEKVSSIGDDAFNQCSSIKTIISRNPMPPKCSDNTFSDVNKWECTLYVPEGSVEAYKNAPGWKELLFVEIASLDETTAYPARNAGFTIEGNRINCHTTAKLRITALDGRTIYHGTTRQSPELPSGFYLIELDNITHKIHIR